MQYMLLIYSGEATNGFENLSEAEQQAIMGEYYAISETPGVSGGNQLQPSRDRDHRPRRGRPGPDHRRALRDDQGGPRRLLPARGRRPRRRARDRGPDPGRQARRRDRGATRGGTLIERVFRDEWGRVLATLVGFLGDIDLAEEATQSAFAAAAERWPREGAPANPRAWLIATARNRAIDRIRRDRTLAAKAHLLEVSATVDDEIPDTTFPDERLELVFTCCHPALATEAQVALALRTLGGLTRRRSPAPSSSPSRRWRSGWCGRRRRSATPGSPSGFRPTTCSPTASRRCWPSST